MRREERRLGREDLSGREAEGSRKERRSWGGQPSSSRSHPGHSSAELGALEIRSLSVALRIPTTGQAGGLLLLL